MTDHPLTPDPVRDYLDAQNLEKVMNTGINRILREKPSDALSALAVYLTSNAIKKPIFSKFECEETLIGGRYRSFDTHVYIDFAGETKCRHTHTYTYEATEGGETEDAQVALAERISKAMQVINTEVNEVLDKTDLSLIKKTDLTLKKFYDERFGPKENHEEDKGDSEKQVGDIVVRVCSEALVHAVAK